jgi:hypothetical protein
MSLLKLGHKSHHGFHLACLLLDHLVWEKPQLLCHEIK